MQVLLDPDDDARVTAVLLTWHAPGAGRVCVHPTPATRSSAALAHDVLAALGRPASRFSVEGLGGGGPAWRAVAAWMNAEPVQHLVVLRADRLAPSGWAQMLSLCRSTNTRLTLVCHRPTIPARLANALTSSPHTEQDDDQAADGADDDQVVHVLRDVRAVVADLPRRRGRRPRDGHDVEPTSRPVQVVGTPAPRCGYPVTVLRRRAFAQMSRATFARVDAQYTAAADATEQWLRWWKPPRAPQFIDRHLFLCELVHDSPSRTTTLLRLRGYQAGFRRRGDIEDIAPVSRLLDPSYLGGPGLTGQPFTAEVLARIRAAIAHPVVAAGLATCLFTGLSPAGLAVAGWGNVSPGAEGIFLTRERRTIPRVFNRLEPMLTAHACFWVPPLARPLLLAARNFGAGHRGSDRMFPPDLFGQPHLLAALKATALPLGDQVHDLDRLWLVRGSEGTPHRNVRPDEQREQFHLDQSFDPDAADAARVAAAAPKRWTRPA